MKTKLLIIFYFIVTNIQAQFAPAAGIDGTTAIYKDSSIFTNWAINCTITRGFQDLSDINLGYASVGDSTVCTGIADAVGVASLGDNGTAVLTFLQPIINGVGWDFAVFENGFDGYFLELAFVEVSSDGVNYFRFPCTSYTQDTAQIGAFDLLDPTKINNLAGKYKALYGTPFDLEELSNIEGLNINNITHVRVQDVIGSINADYANQDQNGNKINDPWTTPFPSGGFDLDAVGVINQAPVNTIENINNLVFEVYPNPSQDKIFIKYSNFTNSQNLNFVEIKDVASRVVFSSNHLLENQSIDVSHLYRGIYFMSLISGEKKCTKKIILR